MLAIKNKRAGWQKYWWLSGFAILLAIGGGYLLVLVGSPAMSPLLASKPIDITTLSEPTVGANRIIIPKIGVDIEYGEGEQALDNGAQWRFPERGDPKNGGNFIIAAHRFTLAPTPMETIRKSPFYHIEKLKTGDEIIVDYDGKRYGYTISKEFSVKPNQTEIESSDTDNRLTLYSCGLGGVSDKRVVIIGDPLGEVTVQTGTPSRS